MNLLDLASKMDPKKCPICDTKLSTAMPTQGDDVAAPRVGDFCLCIGCAAVLRFGDEMQLLIPESEEFSALDPADREALFKARALIQIGRSGRKR